MVDVNSHEQAVRLMNEAFNRGDVEAVLSFYEDAAVVVMEPGKMARGQSELRAFLQSIMRPEISAPQIKTYTIEADGVALFLSRWILITKNSEGESVESQHTATTVFRKNKVGTWKALIDNSFGPAVLGPQ